MDKRRPKLHTGTQRPKLLKNTMKKRGLKWGSEIDVGSTWETHYFGGPKGLEWFDSERVKKGYNTLVGHKVVQKHKSLDSFFLGTLCNLSNLRVKQKSAFLLQYGDDKVLYRSPSYEWPLLGQV